MVINTTEQMQQVIASDPELQRLAALIEANPNEPVRVPQFPNPVSPAVAFALRLQAAGHEMAHDFRFRPSTGEVYRENFVDRNGDWLAAIPGIVGAGWSLAGAAGAGGGSAVAGSAGTGSAASGAAGAGAGILGELPDWLKVGLTAGLPLLGRAISGGSGGPGGTGPGVPPELSELLGLSMNRVKSQQPLFDAVNRQQMAGLPSETLLPAPGGVGVHTQPEGTNMTELLRLMGGR